MSEELYDTTDVDAVILPFNEKDIRFTSKGNVVYATLLDWPTEQAVIKTLGNMISHELKIKDVLMLGSDNPIEWGRQDDGIFL